MHPCEAAGGGAPTQSGESVLARPASAAAAAARSGIIQAWVESARATLARGAANFSGFSLPAPSELMELLPPRPQLARAHGKAARAAPAAVDPDAAAALRRRVEGSIMTRSASAASLDTAVPHGTSRKHRALRVEFCPAAESVECGVPAVGYCSRRLACCHVRVQTTHSCCSNRPRVILHACSQG